MSPSPLRWLRRCRPPRRSSVPSTCWSTTPASATSPPSKKAKSLRSERCSRSTSSASAAWSRRGCIVNIASLAGLCGMPALGQYCATKFAVVGLSEALRKEVEPLGIHVLVVEPSGFRTDWAGRSAHESARQIDDYQATAGKVRLQVRASSGQQAGDPARAAQAILQAVAMAAPPHHLLLGNDAFEGAIQQVDALRRAFMAGESVARGADSPAVPAKALA